MSSAGSAYTFRFPSPAADNGAVPSSCIPCGLVRRRDGNTLTASVLGCRFSSLRMKRKILKMYHQTALQPLVQTVWPSKRRTKRFQFRVSSAPLEEGVTVHGMPCRTQNKDAWVEVRKMLDASLDIVATDANLEQALHETARMFQLAIEKQRSLTKGPWFAKAWLGIDHNAWIKSIAYQAAGHALIQAALKIAGRREGKGSVVCTTVQQSLLHLCKPLEDSIHLHLSSRDPAAEDWLWCQQHSVAVEHFTSKLEKDPRFTGLAVLDWQEGPQSSNKELVAILLSLALSICATIMKLGPGKLSCSAFSVELAEETGRLMDSFVEYASIDQVYHFASSVGLRSEFLSHFGSRAALDKGDSNLDEGERVFWIELVQQSLRGAFAREGFQSKLSSFTNIEDLQTVEEVLFKLEGLLKKSDSSRFQNWKVHLTAIMINLRKIRRLKKEAEALEVSLKHKASFKETFLDQTKLQQVYDNERSQRYNSSGLITEHFELAVGDVEKSFWQQRSSIIFRISTAFEMATNMAQDWTKKLPFFSSSATNVLNMKASSTEEDDAFDMAAAAALDEAAAVSKEAAQFEVLRLELIKLDSRIRECTGEPSIKDVSAIVLSKKGKSTVEKGKVWDFLSKSTEHFKNASLDMLKGTQLLGMDVTVALDLLRNCMSGHELTERERKIMRRTCTDLASVIPIGFLMLLPVTAVGHAAMLAAIQKYIPALGL